MRLFKRRLRDRVKSLEEYLGVAFSNDDYPQHEDLKYSEIERLKARVKALEPNK